MADEPDQITIQHVLVSFKETAVQADRSRDEAESLAGQLLERARGGEDFAAMVVEHSDDPVQPGDEEPGVYRLLNRNGGVPTIGVGTDSLAEFFVQRGATDQDNVVVAHSVGDHRIDDDLHVRHGGGQQR